MADEDKELQLMMFDNEKLIRIVKNYPEIWNPRHRFYRDFDRTKAAWNKIALANFDGIPAGVCKKRWVLLREGFRRNLRKRIFVNGINTSKPWKYAKQMEFIIPCYQNSYPPQENPGEENVEEKVVEKEEVVEIEEVVEVGEEEIVEVEDEEVVDLVKEEGQEEEELAIVNEPHYTEKDASSSHDSQKEVDNEHEKLCVGEDHLSKFFFAMEAAVRALPQHLQVEVKKQIFQVVSDAEMTAITNLQCVSAEPGQVLRENQVEYVLSMPDENYTTVIIKPEGD